VLTYDNSTGTLFGYVNGTVDGSVSTTPQDLRNAPASTYIGNDAVNAGFFWNGSLDEIRISSVPRSADWITTEYNNQSSPSTFETLGIEVTNTPIPSPEPIIVIPEERNVGGARGWKKRLLDEKLWMDKQDEMFLKIANEDDLDVVHVLTDFLSRV
jgi:hypothetical protein